MLSISLRYRHRAPLLAILSMLSVAVAAAACNSLRYGLPAIAAAGAVEREHIITLPAMDLAARSDHHAAPQPAPLHSTFGTAGWMHGFTVEAIDAEGETVPLSVLHHIKVLMPDRRELFMPIALRLVGAGSETRTARVPRSMGIPFEAGDSLLVTAMVHNPTERDLSGVTIRMRLHYTSAPTRPVPDAVYPFFLHVAAPDGPSEFDLPPGYTERSWEARPAVGGYIMALGGHLHRYGLGVRLEDLTTGDELWRTRAEVDSLGNVIGIPRKVYRWSRGPRMEPEHVYRVTATYFNPTEDTIRGGGMGTVGGVFRPDDAWPSIEPGHPLYRMDLARELGQQAAPSHDRHGGGGAHDH